MDDIYAEQQMDKWCWAATIQIVLRYYGVYVAQSEIARAICGIDLRNRVRNCAANALQIGNTINSDITNEYGWITHQVEAPLQSGRISNPLLFNQLNNKRPVIFTFHPPGSAMGHAMIATSADFIFVGQKPIITKLVVRDPWPSDANVWFNGRKEFTGNELTTLLNSMTAYWLLTVYQMNAA